MLVDGALEQVRLTAWRDDHLVEVRRAARLTARCFHSASNVPAELVAPAPDRLVLHDHAALKQQFFDVAQAQLEAATPAHCATDAALPEAVTVIEQFRFV